MGNAPSSAPFSAQSTLLNYSAPCSYNNNTILILTTISATSPLVAGTGQQIYYSDLTASITFPPSISQADASLSQYTANVTIVLSGDNISPSQFVLNEFVGYNSFNSPGPSVTIPKNGGVLDPLGPATLTGPDGQVADLSVSYIQVELQKAAADNTNIGPVQEIVCQNFGVPPILAGTTIDTSSGPPLAPANGVPGSFPPTPGDIGGTFFSLNGSKSTVANVPITCSDSRDFANGQSFNLSLQGTAPVQLAAGYQHNITNLQTFFTIPGNVAFSVDGFYGGKTSDIFVTLGKDYNGNNLPGKAFGAEFFYSTVGSLDLARNFTASNPNTPNPLSTGRYVDAGSRDAVTFAFPNDGFLTTTPFGVYSAGGIFAVRLDNLQGAINGYSVDFGQPSGAENFNCTPNGSYFLFRAGVQEFFIF